MIRFPRHLALACLSVAISGALGSTVFAVGVPQETRQPQTSGVDNTKMGPYRALAQLANAAAQKGDGATASQLARILERVWDKAEDYGGDTALSKTNPTLFKEVDKAMDEFIADVQAGAKTPPEATKLKLAYNNYLEKLHLVD